MAHQYIFAILLFISLKGFSQSKKDSSDIVYQPSTEVYFKNNKEAKLIVDYYFTDGWSTSDRYSYEIILIDSLLMINFSSPSTDSYKYISYEKKNLLEGSDIDSIKHILEKAKLRQSKIGIPSATFSAYTKEVLIVRYKNIKITGGLAYGNEASYPNSESEIQIKKEINEDRRQSSSISGNYDLLISLLKRYFIDLDKLKMQSKYN